MNYYYPRRLFRELERNRERTQTRAKSALDLMLLFKNCTFKKK